MPDQLSIWVDAAARTVTAIPLGTAGPGSSEDFVFRVLNSSASYTATSVSVSFTGADAGELLLSDDGVNFAATLALGNLPPAARTGPITFRRATPYGADGAADVRLRCTTAGWTL